MNMKINAVKLLTFSASCDRCGHKVLDQSLGECHSWAHIEGWWYMDGSGHNREELVRWALCPSCHEDFDHWRDYSLSEMA